MQHFIICAICGRRDSSPADAAVVIVSVGIYSVVVN